MKFKYLLVLVMAGWLGLTQKVMAIDSGLSLVISPLPINLVAEPGSVVTTQLKVKNNGLETERIQAGLMKFGAFGEEGKPRLMDREVGDTYFDWVKFSENDFEVAPNEWKTITMTIEVPPEAAFGYYYAVTFSRKDETIAEGPLSTKIVGATATLVLLDVKVANAVKEMEVVDFRAGRKMYEFLPVNFLIKLKNKGNVHLAPRGNIFITRMGAKKEVAVLEVNDVKGSVLPDSNRIFEVKWDDGFPVYQEQVEDGKTVVDSMGIPRKVLKWNFSNIQKLRWGRYTASMLVVYDGGQRDVPVEAKLSFWVIPWRIIGVAAAMGLLMLGGVILIIATVFRILKKK